MTTHHIHLDVETKGTIDLRKVGAHVYAEHPDTDLILAAYAVDDEPAQLWLPGQPAPEEWQTAIDERWEVHAFNAAFEMALLRGVGGPRHHWPIPKLEDVRCTMVAAMALSLPASLKNATRAVGIDDGGKADDGHLLMLQMCKPRRPRKGELPNGVYWFDDEERIQRLGAVCKKDVEDERELGRLLLALRPSEQALWELDQRINDRGVYVDTALCENALKVVEAATAALNSEIQMLTEGAVSATTNVAQIAKWMRESGFKTTSLEKEAIDEFLTRQDLPPTVRRVLEIRREAAKASVKKIDALVSGRSKNGRAKGLLQFHAAGTGRWAGRRFQPQNIVRPTLDDIDGAIEAVGTGDADYVRVLYGEPLAVVGDCLRGMVRAAPGNVLYAADFSNIEGRIQAWLGNEQWKLNAFRAYDTGTGPDVYKLAVSNLFSIPVETVTKAQRQDVGKVMELASGYQGGVSAYLRFGIAEAFPTLIPTLRTTANQFEWDSADEMYVPSQALGLTREQWCAVKISVTRWRDKHPGIVQQWYDLETAGKKAVQHRGEVFTAGRIAFRVAGSFLLMLLPSGRCIAYPYPCIRDKAVPWGGTRPQISYKGVDQYTRQWTDCFAHGGLLFNNVVQGIARDIEADAMIRVERAGYWNILNVHDEVVTETRANFGSVEQYQRLMSELEPIYAGLPVSAEAWSAERYRK